MSEREGVLWDAMRAAAEILDINREGMQGEKAFNANVTPVVDLAKAIVEKCAAIADKHQHIAATEGRIIDPYVIAEEIRELIK